MSASRRLSDDYLTPARTAEQLGIGLRTLARYRTERIGPAFIKVGRRILYRFAKLEEWLLANETQPPRERT